MIKQYFNILILLGSSWSVYAYCQNDTFLPMAIVIILALSLLLRFDTTDKQFAVFGRMPLSTIIIISFVAGFIWRNIFPAPEDATSPFPLVTAALQSATIIGALFIWLKPFTKKNMYHLIFLAWLTVALSINVPFNQRTLFIFCFFCIIATAIIILHTMKKPKDPKNFIKYYRDFIIFSTLLVMITTALFYGISRTIVLLDKTFINLMNGLITPNNYTHFLKIDSKLHLGNPGRSAYDRRPVLEITVPKVKGLYLKTQVFGEYNDGVWEEELSDIQYKLPSTLNDEQTFSELTMFTSFEDIIPSPNNVSAARGNAVFTKSSDQILYTPDEQEARILTLSLDATDSPVKLTRDEYRLYTSVPEAIAADLLNISNEIIGNELDIQLQAKHIQDFFQTNFRYSLSVNFQADNKGILDMIRRRRPAYCSYFASAMVLLVRSQGIPARVSAGFLTSELSDRRQNKFLTRVNNAHAWTEVLIPRIDPETNQTYYIWKIFDPTPIAAMNETLNKSGIQWERLAENIWLNSLRLRAKIESIDKAQMKLAVLFFLFFILIMINRKVILNLLYRFYKNKRKILSLKKQKPSPTQKFYAQYENLLKERFNEVRRSDETDHELTLRLKQNSDVPAETLTDIENFLKQYQAARFGEDKNIDLKKPLKIIQNQK